MSTSPKQAKNNSSLSNTGNTPVDWYGDSMAWLSDELALLALRLTRLFNAQVVFEASKVSTNGYYIPSDDVAAILSEVCSKKTLPAPDAQVQDLDKQIEHQVLSIEQRLRATHERGKELPVDRLQCIFGLSKSHVRICIMALAPVIDRRFYTVYAWFNDDMTKKMVTVGCAVRTLFASLEKQCAALSLFAEDSALVTNRIIHLSAEGPPASINQRTFSIDDRIARYLFGDTSLCDSTGLLTLCQPVSQLQQVVQAPLVTKMAQRIIQNGNRPLLRVVFWLYGKGQSDAVHCTQALGQKLDMTVARLDLAELWQSSDCMTRMQQILRECALSGVLLYVTSGELLYAIDERSNAQRPAMIRTLSHIPGTIVICAESLYFPSETAPDVVWETCELELPDFTKRCTILNTVPELDTMPQECKADIAARFAASETTLRTAAKQAALLSADQPVEGAILSSILRATPRHRLNSLAKKIKPRYHWTDIVLPADSTNHFHEIADHIKHKHTVYHTWGFGKRISRGKGVNILFSGPSGTGKTMAADVIANELGFDIYTIDLSMVVSKYIGETEKNLSIIFKEADNGNTILFFDEADALFGKRSEVKDSHDRYSNIEVGYLLQQMEEHDSVVILATNLSKNIDEAFARRMNFSLEFPFPAVEQRKHLWQGMFPAQTPRNPDIDFDFLAEKIKLTGGNIRNIVLTAAFFAARDNIGVGMSHVLAAMVREYQKIGKPFVAEDFKRYQHFLQEA